EESDAGWRLAKAGKIYFSADAAVTHPASSSGGTRIYVKQFDDFGFYANDLLFVLRTVKLRHMPRAMFKRLRIYSGGDGRARRFYRASLLACGLLAGLWRFIFERSNFIAKEVKS